MPDPQTTELPIKINAIYGSIGFSHTPYPHGSWVYRNEDGCEIKRVPLDHMVCLMNDGFCVYCGRNHD